MFKDVFCLGTRDGRVLITRRIHEKLFGGRLMKGELSDVDIASQLRALCFGGDFQGQQTLTSCYSDHHECGAKHQKDDFHSNKSRGLFRHVNKATY
ncbi:hypothetical protein CEXT_123121 [Caerostris extrusa]|uniref:Uncharacterized protein n=1 Tax=Caerostris extrusa TaxID=172846 RepID=A0AAV4QLD1_CAEEX|nr:hypothetical protein CEXT_123121 [Caerostris extrusa]